jgi:hypothetical protein
MRALIPLLLLLFVAPPVEAASKQQCRQACQAQIDGCLRACGAFGDMARFQKSCARVVMRRCRDGGVEACQSGAEPPTTTTLTPTTQIPTTTTTLLPCGVTAPSCDGACPAGNACNQVVEGDKVGCACEPTAQACGQTFPACDGVCRTGLACAAVAGGCVCRGFLDFPGTTTSSTASTTSSTSSTSTTSTTESTTVVSSTTAVPTCFDRIQNQDETGVDCGGSICARRCTRGAKCLDRFDCESAFSCLGGICL